MDTNEYSVLLRVVETVWKQSAAVTVVGVVIDCLNVHVALPLAAFFQIPFSIS